MLIPRWRNIFTSKNTLIPTLSQSTTSITNSHFASIHSTPTTCEKWKNKWKPDLRSFNNHLRYAVRQKRADAKRALNDLLFNSGSCKASFQDEDPIWAFDPEKSHGTDKKQQRKPSARHSGKSNQKKMKRKFGRERFSEDSDDPETIFQATFGNRWYTWSFRGSSFRSSTFGFEWREHPSWKNNKDEEWDARIGTESYNESCSIGCCHDRTILGLPPSGPIRIEDVKNAFRISALKWHPDKHQGSSQAMAEEKFKLCVNAYKSLCDALSRV